MFIAKIQSKTIEGGVLTIHVEFTDGVNSVVESCKPQNEDGLRYWVRSRLETFNAGTVIASTYTDGSTVDVSDPIVVLQEPTAEEVARTEWLALYRKWIKVKTTLVDTSMLTGTETPLINIKNKVKADFLPAYLDFI